MHPRHVQPLVRMSDDVAEARRTLEPNRQVAVDVPGVRQPAKRLRVGTRSTELEMETGGHRQIDDDLDGLPEVQDDGVRSVRGESEAGRILGQPLGDTPEVSLNRGSLLGEDLAIERAQRVSSASRSS